MSYYLPLRGTCSRPDPGWNCSGDEGHSGPCASWPDDPRLDPEWTDEKILEVFQSCLVILLVAVILVLVGIGVLIGLAIK